MCIKLQIAIDCLDLDEARQIADSVSPWFDIIEAGTPLIKSIGKEAVQFLKLDHPSKLIVADLKSSDVGAYEADMAFNAGADITTTLAVTTNATIREVQRIADKRNKVCLVDLTGAVDIVNRVKELKEHGVTYFLYHQSIDEEIVEGKTWDNRSIRDLEEILQLGVNVSIAGGIKKQNLHLFSKLDLFSIVIGRGITSSRGVGEEAKSFAKFVDKIFCTS
jgi:3-hexulose-6-phosphate synthase